MKKLLLLLFLVISVTVTTTACSLIGGDDEQKPTIDNNPPDNGVVENPSGDNPGGDNPDGHVWQRHEIEPTCEEGGYIVDFCEHCGAEQIVNTFGEPLGHNYIDGFCSRCGTSESGGGGITDTPNYGEFPDKTPTETKNINIGLGDGVHSVYLTEDGLIINFNIQQDARYYITILDVQFKIGDEVHTPMNPGYDVSLFTGDTLKVIIFPVYGTCEIQIHVAGVAHNTYTTIENKVDATCSKEGSYDEVVYCSNCSDELSRTQKTTDKLKHTAASTVRENIVEPTCIKQGSYDDVVYCSVCKEELSRTKTTVEITDCTPDEAVRENEKDATCKEYGSYDIVTYCSICDNEITRTTVTTEEKGSHNYVDGECTVCEELKPSDGLAFSISNNTATVIGKGECNDTRIVIPEKYAGLPVTNISSRAFYNCTKITEIIISNGVKTIGDYAFAECTRLSKIVIPDTVTSIGNYAFRYSGITSLTIGTNVSNIGTRAFSECNYLNEICFKAINMSLTADNEIFYRSGNNTKIIIGNQVQSIPAYIFAGFSSATSLEFEKNSVCESIGNASFRGCSGLSNVEIASSIKALGDYAFSGCTSLTALNLGDVLTIGQYTFANCAGLNTLVMPGSVTAIGDYAFCACTGLTDLNLGNVVTIGQYVFYECTGLKTLVIPDSVTTIASSAFSSCSGLTDVIIHDSVISIGYGAFQNCSDLARISLPFVGASATDSKHNYLGYIFGAHSHNENGQYVPTTLTDVTLNCSFIPENAFHNCLALQSITVRSDVTDIGAFAFAGCTNLTSVYISDLNSWCNISFGTSSSNPLYYADNLYLDGELVTRIQDDITSISAYAFYDYDKLISINLTALASIGQHAFYGCDKLADVTIDGNGAIIGSSAFAECSVRSLTIGNGVESISNNAFYLCQNLVFTTIGDSVASIGNEAFMHCNKLVSITISSSVSSIGENAFTGCLRLAEIINHSTLNFEIGKTTYGSIALNALEVHKEDSKVVNLNDYLFYTYDNVDYLVEYIGEDTALILPERYNGEDYKIRKYAFYHDALSEVVIPNTVTEIEDDAFYECEYLTDITIPNSITHIGGHAFYQTKIKNVYITSLDSWCNITFGSVNSNPLFNATNLYVKGVLTNYVIVPDGITEIKAYAFYFPGLTGIYVPDSVTKIAGNAFTKGALQSISLPFAGASKDGTENTHFGYIFGATSHSNNSQYVPSTLKSVTIRGGSIYSKAFYGCSSLTKIVVGDEVTYIGEGAFQGCSALKTITIPFVGNSADEHSHFGTIFGKSSSYAEPAHYHYISDGYYWTYYIPTTLKTVIIGNGTNIIDSGAFTNCHLITSLFIPQTVTYISGSPFGGCDNLTLYCESSGALYGWNSGWNYYNAPVIWNASKSDIE